SRFTANLPEPRTPNQCRTPNHRRMPNQRPRTNADPEPTPTPNQRRSRTNAEPPTNPEPPTNREPRTPNRERQQTSSLESPPVDPVLSDLVVHDARRRLQQTRGLRAVAARHLQRILDEILLDGGYGGLERLERARVARIRHLQRRRQMMRVDD